MSDHEQPPGPDPPSPTRPQNVKPHPEGRKSSRKSLRVRRSQSSGSERGVRRQARERHKEERGRRRRSEEAHRSRSRDAKPSSSLDRKTPPSRDGGGDVDDTECIVCFCSYDNVFKTPKLLACGHTFCLECLARINVSSPEVTSLSCPMCREPTQIPHGRDLPQLGNNLAVFRKLPPEMQRALSVRFKRSKGKLFLKKTATLGEHKAGTITLPKKKQPEGAGASAADPALGQLELEAATPAATVLNVGQPPSRVRCRLRRLFNSDRCYYVVVAAIVTITVVLMLVGVLAFVIMPNIAVRPPPPLPVNDTVTPSPSESPNTGL